MDHPGFFERAGPYSIADIARAVNAEFSGDGALMIDDVSTLVDARATDLSFFNNKKYVEDLKTTSAGGCMLRAGDSKVLPAATIALVTQDPYRSFADALRLFYPDSLRPKALTGDTTAAIDPSAVIEAGAVVEPGALIGPEAHIGRGTRIAAGAVIGYRCMIGRDGYIGAGATVTHALIGDRVVIHAGVRLGQDGFGFAMGPAGHYKVPQIGRVIIQDDVEIGANSTIDRGALRDTIIGEGTKIDNLVQIGHNVVTGRHCVIVAQVGIAGSAVLGDFVVMGGQSGCVGHITIGSGAQIAGSCHPTEDVPAGAKMGGTPARPLREWAREVALVRRMAKGDR